jgi:Lon protease-like protein
VAARAEEQGGDEGIGKVRYLPPLDYGQQTDLEPSPGSLVLPCFPLGAVYMPYANPILNIFEPRYRKMYSDILFSGGRRFIVPATRQGQENEVCLGEVGVVLYLDELQEVSEQTNDQVKFVCQHSVIGRVRLKKVLNPRSFADQSTYLRVECEDMVDSDADVDCAEGEKRLEGLVTSLQELQAKSGAGQRPWLSSTEGAMNATRGPGFWKLVSGWESYLGQRMQLRKAKFEQDLQQMIVSYLKSTQAEMPPQVSLGELPEELQREVALLQEQYREEISPLIRVYRDSVQVLVQAESHGERLEILSGLLEQERKRVEAQLALKNIFGGS